MASPSPASNSCRRYHVGPRAETLRKQRISEARKRHSERAQLEENVRTAKPSPTTAYGRERLDSSLTALNEYARTRVPRVWSHEVTILIIQYTIIVMMVFHIPITQACNLISLIGRSSSYLQPKVGRWIQEEELTWKPPEPRGAAAAKYNRAGRVAVKWTDAIREHIIAWKTGNGGGGGQCGVPCRG